MGNATIRRFLDDLITFFKTLQETVKGIEYPHKFLDDLKNLRDSLTTNSEEGRNIVAMSQEELNAFREHKKNLKHEWQIDTYNAYMIGVLTGFRQSDIKLLENSYINQSNQICINLQKTNFWATVPVRKELQDILDYYNGSVLGKIPTIQRLNINLRKILKNIPIFQRADKEYVFTLNNKKVLDVKRWERFTFHTSRKTFITLAIRNGATYDQIKGWTGIQDYRTLNHYMEYQNGGKNDSNILNF
jgi:Phage integrase family.